MLRRCLVTVLAVSAVALGQSTAQQAQPNAPSPGSPGSSPRRSNPDPSTTQQNNANRQDTSSTDTVWGRVVLSDGDDSGAGVRVQRVCGSVVSGETFTDSSGHFTVSRPPSNLATDATSTSSVGVWGCELRAALSGYQTGTWSLANRKAADNTNIVIILRRVGAAQGLTVSATTLLAPPAARKSYGKGLDAAHHNEPDQAQKDFANAVRIYPRFAAAWFELGKVYEQRDHRDQAREAYAKSIAADGKYLYPSERLYLLDIKESKWQEAVDASNKILHLDPYDFPGAFYFNAVSNLALNNLGAAEHSAREAAKLEGSRAEPKANYVLGVILWRKGDLAGASDRLRAFLADSADSSERASAQRMLADIQKLVAKAQVPASASR